jgi:autotransporter family porin
MSTHRTIAAVAVLLVWIVAGTVVGPPTASAAVTTSVPTRVLDTRNGVGRAAGLVVPGEVVRVTMPSVTAGASSLALNLTATNALAPGFLTAWACDEAKPTTSNLNFVSGHAVANMAIIRPSAVDRQVCLEVSVPVHLLVDLMGWFTGSGDVSPVAPNRVVDTRQTGDPLASGEFRRLPIAGTRGIPATASSTLLNVTLTGTGAPGFASVVPCPAAGGAPPSTSTLNFAAGATVAAFTVATLVGGDVCVYSSTTANLIVDAFGTVSSTGGLRGTSPQRVLDTRNGVWSSGPAQSNAEVKVRLAGRGGVPNSALGALVTVTVSDTTSDGHVTAWPCDAPKPDTSILNFSPGSARANLAIVGLAATSGEICLSSYTNDGSSVALIADVVGYVPGSVDRGPVPPPPVSPPPSGGSGGFVTLPVGSVLPSGAECAGRVRRAVEVRPENGVANANRGSRANANTRADWSGFARVDGDFAGTTDEIIQWAACKWGIDENIVRAQVIKESYWYQSANGDNGESWGLGQVRDTAHQSAFQFGSVNARNSSAYNLDYTYASWRACFEGVYTWLNTVERNGTYAAGDVWGCLGVWFSGRWYVNNDAYLNQPGDSVRWHYDNKTWLTSTFING